MNNPILGNESYQTWNARHRRYMAILIDGNLEAVQAVVNEIETLAKDKVLAFGERKVLEAAKGILNAPKVKHLTVLQGGRS